MQTIKAGKTEIKVVSIYGERKYVGDTIRQVLRLQFPEDTVITQKELIALTSNPWEIYSPDGELEGTHTGFTDVLPIEVQFAKSDDFIKQIDQLTHQVGALETQLTTKEQEIVTLRGELEDAKKSIRVEPQLPGDGISDGRIG